MLLVLVLSLVAACAAEDRFDASKSLTTVPYAAAQIVVWKDEEAERFYTSPLARLIPGSAVIVDNFLTGQMMVEFSVALWSSYTREVVRSHLQTNLNLSVSEDQIRLLPIEKVRLEWSDVARPLRSPYQVVDSWRPYTDVPSQLRFNIVCQDKCDDLQTALTSQPRLLYALDLVYVTDVPRGMDHVAVTGTHVAETRVFADLTRMNASSDLRYLTADAADKLAAETAAAAMSSFHGSVTAADGLSLIHSLKTVLKRQTTSTESLPSWESVYWRPIVSRPDRIAAYLNAVLNVEPTDTDHFLVDEARVSQSADHGGRAMNLELIRGNWSTTGGNRSVYKASRDHVIRAARARHVVWSGERFIAAPLTVYTANMAELSFPGVLVKKAVRKQSLTRRARVGVTDISYSEKLSAELVQARLREEITSLTTELQTALNQTRVNVNQTIANLQKTVNETRNNLAHMSSRAVSTDVRLSRIGNVFRTWPEYCRLSSRYCGIDAYYKSSSSARSATECMRLCDAEARCQGFGLWSDQGTRCRLYDYICPLEKRTSHSSRDLYIKLPHVPIVTVEMWRSIFVNGSLVNMPADPCHLVGKYITYTRV